MKFNILNSWFLNLVFLGFLGIQIWTGLRHGCWSGFFGLLIVYGLTFLFFIYKGKAK